jgi:predicted O-methyltransferase YrrM
MTIAARLFAIYEKCGVTVTSGVCSPDFATAEASEFTRYFRDGKSLTIYLGIALREVYFLECLFDRYKPRMLFAIGNSWGFSTIALALLNPDARVIVLDAGVGDTFGGIAFTNAIAKREGLNISVIHGSSPASVPSALATIDDPVDFVFVDGKHTNDQLYLDCEATRPYTRDDTVFLFHDVASWKLVPGVVRVSEEWRRPWFMLDGTPSGMAIMFDPRKNPRVWEALAPFYLTKEVKQMLLDTCNHEDWQFLKSSGVDEAARKVMKKLGRKTIATARRAVNRFVRQS